MRSLPKNKQSKQSKRTKGETLHLLRKEITTFFFNLHLKCQNCKF